jgi:hypothetical protein
MSQPRHPLAEEEVTRRDHWQSGSQFEYEFEKLFKNHTLS